MPYDDPGQQGDDTGYTTEYPTERGGWHKTIWSTRRDRYSIDTDKDDVYIPGSGHYTDPNHEVTDFEYGDSGG